MHHWKFNKIIRYIIERGIEAVNANTDEFPVTIDYLSVFAKDEAEYQDMIEYTRELGRSTDSKMSKTGKTILLKSPIETEAGLLKVIKIRKPDATRPQRGAPDFKVGDYQEFKNKYLMANGNFTLMLRADYEMIELKGVDVLVYFPSKLFKERAG
ncbi:MAG: hypothetical protein WC693_00470 [Patescibacteria group bacterium]|jgi:hypothetical protein